MGVSGAYREVSAPGRIVHTERFDEAWYSGEAVIATVLADNEGVTTTTATINCESKTERDAVAATGIESGLAARCDALEAPLTARA
jgi:uncharacterized protein YndB with AHSA1/START domain